MSVVSIGIDFSLDIYGNPPKVYCPEPMSDKDVNITLRNLIAMALKCPARSPERQRQQSLIYREVMQSGKLWRGYSYEREYYNDAVQEMWEHCFQSLDAYNPDIQEVLTWLNDNLRRILNRYQKRRQRERARLLPKLSLDAGLYDPIDVVPSRPDTYLSFQLLEHLWYWVNTDPDEVLQNRVCPRYAHINAQTLLKRRLPPLETPWEIIAKDLEADKTYISQWYARYCYALLRSWGYTQGYLDSPKNSRS